MSSDKKKKKKKKKKLLKYILEAMRNHFKYLNLMVNCQNT